MTSLALPAILGLLLTASAFALVAPGSVPAPTAAAPTHAAAATDASTETRAVSPVVVHAARTDAKVRFVVLHEGRDTHAAFDVSGGSDLVAGAFLLREGRNVLYNGSLAEGDRSASLRALLVGGIVSFDVADCPEGVTEVAMRTRVVGSAFSIAVGKPQCASA